MILKMQVAGLALRTTAGGAMRELGADERMEVEVDGGVVGNLPAKTAKRGVTFLSRAQWGEVMDEMGADLPWSARRANVLIDGVGEDEREVGSLAFLIGKRIRIGEKGEGVEISIGGETDPCGVMEALEPGLLKAMIPDCRGGVYGRVMVSGMIGQGDAIVVLGGGD